ncbi:MAG: hypothetical protein U0165_15010 [Polyangiaceae bacterium]
MWVLCPACGEHHVVTRILEDEREELTREVFIVAPLAECSMEIISEAQIRDAAARFDREPWIDDDE